MLFFSAPFKPALLFRAGLLSIFFCCALHLPALAQLGGPDLQIMETLRDDYGWDAALGWGSGNPCPVAAPDWPGVICNNGRVSEIQVSCGANKLTTDFPAELNQLTELITLQIRDCWTDPNNPATAKDLTNLSKLNILRLDDNTGLIGTLQDLLGNSMASFPNFGVLEITNSGIGGIIPPDMPSNVIQFIIQTRVGGDVPNNIANVFLCRGSQFEGILPPNLVNLTGNGRSERRIDYNKFDVVNTPSGPVDNSQPGWRNTQTVPPTDVQVTPGATNEATLSWTPIGYTWDGGYYEVLASPTPGGPYTSYGTTESTGGKTATGLTVTGLPGGTNYFVVRTFTPAHTADSLEVYQAYNDPSSLPFQPYLIPLSPGSSFQDTLSSYRYYRDNPNDLTSVNSAEVSAFICPGSILYVNDDAGGNNDGSSWADAFNDLQEALALTASCPDVTEIWVAEGTYKPTSGTDRNISFSMQNGVAIYGGFPNNGNPVFADRDWAAHETILSGDIDTPGDNSDNSIHIITNSNLDASAVLDGFTLSGGNANGPDFDTQEGAAITNFQASPIINNCTFTNNFGTRNGAAVRNVTNCSPVFTNCLFTQNTNGGAGDGVIFDFDGGGSLLINCTISGNSTRSAVLANFANVNTQVQNSILWDNSSNSFFGDFTISHSIVQGGLGACSNCPGGDGNADPLFVDAANGDLRLRECSPAIDAGDNAANSSSLDLDGNPRVFNATGATTIDIGAYEYQSSYDFTSSCTILYVNDDASGNNDGSSWADAFNDLQDALNQARNNPGIAQIWVAEGTYKPTTGMDRGISFSMVNGVAMYGGFPNTGNPVMAQRDWETNVTTLSGDIDGDNTLANNSLLVMNNSGLNSSTLIDGFTITGGNNENFLGGGMSNNTLCNHTISNCRFVENAAFFGGGMVNSGSSSPLITNCIFSGNSAIAGGVGGGILNLTGCTPSIINSLFSGNSANAGGAIFNDFATPTIINCTFYGNIAILGSAINDNNASSTIMNCILWGNGNEIGNNSSPPSNVINSIIQGGFTPCINCPGGDGDVDPFFLDAPNGDFTLQQCSPAIDAGDNNALPAGIVTDLGGNPRFFNNGTVDLGAYEYQATPDPCLCIAERIWTGSVSTDWHTDGNWSPACVPTADNPVIIPDVANDPVISASTAALAQSVHVQSGALLSIQPMASLTINGSASYTSPTNFTAGLNNEGTVDNSGELVLGSVASVGDNGIYNQAVFQNNASGHIRIDRSISNGITNVGTFSNAADITIGAVASVGQVGIFNGSTFQNNSAGHIRIDRSTLEGITNFGTFTNAAEITIGAHESTGLNGLRNNSNFFNNAGGHIQIDRSTNNGLFNDFGTFTNAADITIGANESAGTYGLYNRRAFQNTPGGHIQIDRSTSSEIGNFSGGNFTNAGVINLGALGNTGAEGIRNQATFQNDACAQLFMNAPLSNTASFTNAGLFTVNTTDTHSNSGLTNDGIIVYPQGNPIPNVTNNDLIVGPVAGCESGLSPALGIGSANSFTAAATWYTDEALSTPAGSYNQSSNTFTSSIGAGTHTLYFSVDGTPGCPRTVPITVNLEGTPTPANAGPDQFGVCGTASLAANTPSVGTGQWSILVEADGQGSITDPASPTSSFTGTPGQTYTLRWAISNGSSCPSSSDNVDIEFQQPLVSISVSPLSVDEDEAGNLVYTISRDCASAPITVNFSASGTAIFNTDYSQTGAATFDGATGTVFMDAGVSSVAITFDPVADNTVEPDESITLTLLSGNGYQLSAGMDTATGTILNDDTATLTISNLEQAETNGGTTNFTFQVALDQAVDMPFTVDFATIDGTATVSSGDYTANSGTLSFAGMEMETQFITVAVNGDCLIEADETFTISLSNLQAGSLDVVFGNTTATGTILNDDLLPSLSCPADFSEVTDLDACSSTIALPVPAISDACGGTTLEFRTRITGASQAPASDWSGWMPSNSPEQAFNAGHHEIEWRVISGSGTATCSYSLEVRDEQPPTALCQNITVQLDANGNGSTTAAAVDNGSSDACGVASLSLSQTAFGCAEAGANAETLTVTDVNGNVSTCSTTITVEDNVAPTALCRNVTVQLDANGNGSTTAEAVDNGSSDACGVASLVLSQTGFDCSEAGANAETLTVTDVNGNISTCSTTITVEDNVAPVALCQNVTVQLDANGNGSTTAEAVDNGSNDACGVASLSLSQTAFGCAEAGANAETLTVTDVNGNVSTCSTTITVEDNVAPVALCQNITVQLDANGNGSTTAAAVDNGSSDACGVASLSLSQPSFGCAEAGANAETLTVTDVNGNVSTCSTTITVEDNVAPTALCLNTTVNLEPNGTYALKPTDVYNAGASSDNCGIASVSFPPASFTCDQAGAAFPITVTVEDFSGNTDQCIAMVSVEAGTALPAGWAASDIGSQGAGSSYDYDPCASNNPNRGDFTVSTGAYNLIPNNSDNLAFIGRELCNNGGIQARIEDVSGGYAGLMIRESSAPGAKMVAVYSNLTSLLRREIRTTDNGPRASNTSFAPFPYWLRLVRQNDYIRAFYRTSDNGSWTLFHQAYLPMQPCVEMGLAVFTTDPNGQAQATFSQVQWQSNVGGNSLALFNDGAAAAQPEEREASVFPNPARDAFTLAFSKAPESGGIAILRNQMGQALEQRQLLPGEAATDWDISRLPGGLYLLEVRQGGGTPQVLRVVKAN